jgi:hypothetical protein
MLPPYMPRSDSLAGTEMFLIYIIELRILSLAEFWSSDINRL